MSYKRLAEKIAARERNYCCQHNKVRDDSGVSENLLVAGGKVLERLSSLLPVPHT